MTIYTAFLRHPKARSNLEEGEIPPQERVVGGRHPLTREGRWQSEERASLVAQFLDGDIPKTDGNRIVSKEMTQLENVAAELGPLATHRIIISSDKARCVEDAGITARMIDAEVRIDPRLTEISKGDWEGMPVEDAVEIEADALIRTMEETGLREEEAKPIIKPPGGENWYDTADRVIEVMEEKARQGIRRIALCTHNHPAHMAIGKLTGMPPEEWEDLSLDNGSMTILGSNEDFTENWIVPDWFNVTPWKDVPNPYRDE